MGKPLVGKGLRELVLYSNKPFLTDLKTVIIAKFILKYVRMEYRVGRFIKCVMTAVHILRQNFTFDWLAPPLNELPDFQ